MSELWDVSPSHEVCGSVGIQKHRRKKPPESFLSSSPAIQWFLTRLDWEALWFEVKDLILHNIYNKCSQSFGKNLEEIKKIQSVRLLALLPLETEKAKQKPNNLKTDDQSEVQSIDL